MRGARDISKGGEGYALVRWGKDGAALGLLADALEEGLGWALIGLVLQAWSGRGVAAVSWDSWG